MDQHFLTPLFSPRSIVVFAGHPEHPEAQNSMARTLLAQMKDQGYAGEVTHLDIEMTGTLSDLAHSRADLAIIALPHDRIAAGDRRAHPLPRGAGAVQRLNAALCGRAAQDRAARRRAPAGAQQPGLPAPAAAAQRQCGRPAGRAGPLALVSQSGALTASILDWARQRRGLLDRGLAGPQHRRSTCRRCWTSWPPTRSTHSIVVYMEGITTRGAS
jgi:acetyltransferase